MNAPSDDALLAAAAAGEAVAARTLAERHGAWLIALAARDGIKALARRRATSAAFTLTVKPRQSSLRIALAI